MKKLPAFIHLLSPVARSLRLNPHKLSFLSAKRILLTFLLLSSIGTANATAFLPNPDLDDLTWHVDYVEGDPTWIVRNVSDPFPTLDGLSLQCGLTGGTAYSAVHCYHDPIADPGSDTFLLKMSFYYRPVSTFNDQSSIVQALEFTMSKWSQGLRYEWAVQWENVDEAGDTGAPKWRYWGRDPQNPQQLPKWIDLGVSGSLAGMQWHTLELEGEILAAQTHYLRFTIDGHAYPLNIAPFSPAPATGWPDKLSVGVQLDGNKDLNHPAQLSPYEIFLDQVNFTSLTEGDSVGVFRPSNGLLYLKHSNTTGFADVQINYGLGGDYPVVGDWDGNGTDTIGIYRDGVFYLRNSNTIGFADIVFPFGQPGDQPVAGDWDNDGVETIGVYRRGIFYLRNTNSSGAPDLSFALGIPGDVGIAGDWDGDGMDTTGVFRPSNGALYLKNTNATGFADIQINYGLPGDKPVTGDWDNDGVDTIGVYREGAFYLRNSNTIGFADIVFALGIPGDHPIAGNWDGLPNNSNLQNLIEKAKEDLAQRLSISINQISLVQAREVEWPDTSLGCPQPGMDYLFVIVPGYLIRLDANHGEYEYHASWGDDVFYCENPRPPLAGVAESGEEHS